MIRTIKDLKEAIANIDDDDFVYAVDRNGTPFDIFCVDDSTSIGFWELRLDNTCEFFPQHNNCKAPDTQQK